MGKTHVEAALNAVLYTTFETVLRMLQIPKVLVFTPKLEPRSVMSSFGGALKVAECGAGVVRDELGIDAGRGAHGAHVDGLGDVRRKRALVVLGDL